MAQSCEMTFLLTCACQDLDYISVFIDPLCSKVLRCYDSNSMTCLIDLEPVDVQRECGRRGIHAI